MVEFSETTRTVMGTKEDPIKTSEHEAGGLFKKIIAERILAPESAAMVYVEVRNASGQTVLVCI